MGDLVKLGESYGLSADQIQLIKLTVAKGATDSELQLFLYRCKNMGLDPLKPGQVHFVKYGNNPGTIIVGIDGFRSKAARTGRHIGTKRGLIRDDNGKCIGAWCEVYRSDWSHPARDEVSLSEYNTGKAQWRSMPETMIKKVAEVSALRMAFPDDLGGMYSHEEMDQAADKNVKDSLRGLHENTEDVVLETEEIINNKLEPALIKMRIQDALEQIDDLKLIAKIKQAIEKAENDIDKLNRIETRLHEVIAK